MATSPTQILVNNEATFTVAFMEYTGTNDPGDLVDPDTTIVRVLQNGTVILTDDPVRITLGEYSYTYTFTSVDSYTVEFVGTFPEDDSATPSTYDVVIEEDINVVTGFSNQQKLGQTETIVFATDALPLYIDPEEIKFAFPEASLVEIMELVQKYSLEINRVLSEEERTPVPQIAYDYIREAIMCDLSNVYNAFGGDGGSISLGDLSIDSGRRYSGVLNRGNASNPCERAFVLRQELLRYGQGSKAVIKGGKSVDRILPDRKIRHQVRGDLYGKRWD